MGVQLRESPGRRRSAWVWGGLGDMGECGGTSEYGLGVWVGEAPCGIQAGCTKEEGGAQREV